MNFYAQCQQLRYFYKLNPILNDDKEIKLLSQLLSIAFCNQDELPIGEELAIDCSNISGNCDEIQVCLNQILKDLHYHNFHIWKNHFSICHQIYFTIN